MTQASCKTIINMPADAVWQVIGDFGAACQYLAMMVDCTVVGVGVGALRTLASANGSTIVERLDMLDDVAHRLSYALLTDTPFRDCLTIITVRDLGQTQCEVMWTATFDTDGLPASEAQEMLEGTLRQNGRELQHFLAAQGAVTG